MRPRLVDMGDFSRCAWRVNPTRLHRPRAGSLSHAEPAGLDLSAHLRAVPSGMIRPGALLGSIRIDGVIGRGAMGEVFRGTQVNLRRAVAVKRIAEHLLSTPEALARFEREAQTLARVQSPWVVAVYDFARMKDDQGDEHYLLVMELVEGGRSLRSCIDAPMPWPEATALVLQVARGLAAAAALGVVHRDVKPHNIIVNAKGIAKLADFGLARSADSTDLTVQGMVLGTPAYMAPEACRGESVDGRADLYSLGATWYQLICSRTPFLAENTPAMLRAQVDDAPPRLDQLVPGLPPPLVELVHRLLEKRASDRPANAGILVEQMLRLRQLGLDFPETVVLPPQGGLAPDPTTAATHVVPGGERGAAGAATATADLIAGASPRATRPTLGGQTLAPTTLATAAPAAAKPRRAASARIAFAAIALAAIAAISIAAARAMRSTPERALAAIELCAADGHADAAIAATEQALARFPDDARIIAAGTAVVAAEVDQRLAKDGPAGARELIARRCASHGWLERSQLGLRIDCDDAANALRSASGRRMEQEQEQAFAQIFHDHPHDHYALTRIVDAYYDVYFCDLLVEAAERLAESDDAPSEEVHQTLLNAQRNWGPSGELMAKVRGQLLRHWPDAIALGRVQLDSQDQQRREAAYLLLSDGRALTDADRLRYEARNLEDLGSNSKGFADACADVASRARAADWDAQRAAAKIPPFGRIVALDVGPHDARPHVREVLANAFPGECARAMPAWLGDTEHAQMRWNGWLIAQQLALPPAKDPFAFHAQTLDTFDVESHDADVDAALAYFASLAGTPDAARALQTVSKCADRVAASLQQYRAVPSLAIHIPHVRRSLDRVTELRARLGGPPAQP